MVAWITRDCRVVPRELDEHEHRLRHVHLKDGLGQWLAVMINKHNDRDVTLQNRNEQQCEGVSFLRVDFLLRCAPREAAPLWLLLSVSGCQCVCGDAKISNDKEVHGFYVKREQERGEEQVDLVYQLEPM